MERYVQGALRYELLIAPFLEHLKQIFSESLTGNIYQYFEQNVQALHFCRIQGTLRMELLITPCIERYIKATLEKSYRYILAVLGAIYLNITFCPSFC